MERIKKEDKEKFMERVRKANSEKYETSWENGVPKSKKKSEIKQGKKNRAAGARFELKVRGNLEDTGWIVDKWTNNLDLETGKLIKAKRKFNPYMKILGIGTGFPDFICFKPKAYEIMGVEVKGNGWLDKEEKEKCKILLDRMIFSKILVAKKGKKRGEIEYIDFAKKHLK